MTLELLHTGIPIPEFSTTVPWGISESALYSYIPASQFRGATEHSPSLLFSCLGVWAEFQFDVYTNPDGKFSGVRLYDIDSPSHSFKIDDLSTKVVEYLGMPHMKSDTHVQWYDDFIGVTIRNQLRRRGREWLRYAYLDICNSSYRPGSWNQTRYEECILWANFERLLRDDPAFFDVTIRHFDHRAIHWANGTVATEADLDRLRMLASECGLGKWIDGPYENSVSLIVRSPMVE